MSDSSTVATPPAPTPQPVTQTTFTVYAGPPLETIRLLVASQFQVKDAFLDPYGVPTFQIAAEPPRKKFQTILAELGKQGLIAALRGTGDTLTLKVFQKPQLKPPRKWINLVLFLATVGTVFLAGYLISLETGSSPLIQLVQPGVTDVERAGLFTAALLSIIGLHEFGHKGAAYHDKMDASLPYFIPGFPPVGTFGAVISLRSPPANRNQLFDLGLSGPVVGFAVTIVIGILSVLIGPHFTASDVASTNATLGTVDFSSWPGQPMILILAITVGGILRPVANGGVLFDPQLFFAAQIGCLLTFLNIVPAWQLDGGHISRAVFGPEGHRLATLAGVALLFFAGFYYFPYWTFAFLVLVMMSLSRRGFTGAEPLDDVSPLSASRKALYLFAIALLVLTFGFAPS